MTKSHVQAKETHPVRISHKTNLKRNIIQPKSGIISIWARLQDTMYLVHTELKLLDAKELRLVITKYQCCVLGHCPKLFLHSCTIKKPDIQMKLPHVMVAMFI
jgi:hypothetical protein